MIATRERRGRRSRSSISSGRRRAVAIPPTATPAALIISLPTIQIHHVRTSNTLSPFNRLKRQGADRESAVVLDTRRILGQPHQFFRPVAQTLPGFRT